MVGSFPWRKGLLGVGTIALVCFFLILRLGGGEEKSLSGGSAVRAPQPVSLMTVVPEPHTEEAITTGTVRALEEVDLRVEVSGKLVVLGFEEGRAVGKGTLLLRVDEAGLGAELRRAERRRDLARLREQRLAPLLESGGVSESEFDEARAEVSILEAEMDLIREQIARHSVFAPFDGIVGLRYVSEGSYVTPSTRIASFQNIDEVRLEFSLPEKFASSLATGQQVRFTVVSEETEFMAEIYAIEPRVEVATRTLLVRALADNAEGRLRPGAYARVTWQKKVFAEAIFVPAVAVMQSGEGASVFVTEGGRVERRAVVAGARVRERIRIIDGLEGGEKVITAGTQMVRPGREVSAMAVRDDSMEGP